jgi:hypothetical protein
VNLDRMMYLVICDHPNGPYFLETDLDRCDLVTVCKRMRDKQITDVLAVLEINPIEHIARDATHDFEALIERPDADAPVRRSHRRYPDQRG